LKILNKIFLIKKSAKKFDKKNFFIILESVKFESVDEKVFDCKKLMTFFKRHIVSSSSTNLWVAYVNRYDSRQTWLSFKTTSHYFRESKVLNERPTSLIVWIDVCVRFGLSKSSNLFIHSQKSDENQMTCCNSCEHYCVNVHASWTICLHDSVSHLMYVMKESSKILFQFFLQSRMQEVEKFTFLKLYADSITKLAEWNEQLAKDLCRKIVQYWIYWIEEESNDPILEAMFISFRTMIDRWKEISVQNTENWKKWWRPKNQNKTETKPNWNPTETESKAKKSKIENRKEKIEKENNIILSDDTESKDSEYWNPDVNLCLWIIKSFNWWLIDWTVKNNRRYAKMLIDKLNKLESIKEWRYTRNETLELILNVISKNKYHVSKITSPESIYRNLAVLMQACKNDVWKAQTNQIVLPTI